MIFISCSAFPDFKYLETGEKLLPINSLKKLVNNNLKTEGFWLYQNGVKLESDQHVQSGSTVHIVFGLPGGKGGFGSMLRAIGAQIEKTTNREACRDLSGRRLRDINEEQRLKRWISKEAEREAEKFRRRKERIERLKSQPKHHFNDFEYERERSELPDRIDDALTQGLKKTKSSSSKKRDMSSSEPGCSKKSCPWLDDLSSSSESESNETDATKLKTVGICDKESSRDIASTQDSMNSKSSSSDHAESSNSDQESTSNHSEMGKCPDESNLSTNSRDGIVASDLSQSCDTGDRILSSELGKPTDGRENTSCSETDVAKGPLVDLVPQLQKPEPEDNSPIDVMTFDCLEELEALGLERLKAALLSRGLKCGGTLIDRAQRLWKTKGLEPCNYPANILAKTKKVV